MASFAEIKAERERRKREEKALYDQLNKIHPVDPCLSYTLSSGTRTVISGLFDDRLKITSHGGNPWAEMEGTANLTLGMLSVEDLRELLEIRMVIEAFKAGRSGLPGAAMSTARCFLSGASGWTARARRTGACKMPARSYQTGIAQIEARFRATGDAACVARSRPSGAVARSTRSPPSGDSTWLSRRRDATAAS